MQCPKCLGNMTAVRFDRIEVDKCDACGGLWFDGVEHEVLKAQSAAGAIDTGDKVTGKANNDIAALLCPKCGGNMEPFRDPKQPHLLLERCRPCEGYYFDAGEFKDFQEHTIGDLMKRLFGRKKK